MKETSSIIKKEIKRVFSDKRLVFTLFILPVVICVGIFSLLGNMIQSSATDIAEHVSQVVIVNDNSVLEKYMDAVGFRDTADISYISGTEYESQKEDLENRVLNGSLDLIVYVDEKFEEKYSSYEKAGDAIPYIDFSYNSSLNYSNKAYSFMNAAVLSAMREGLQTERLGNIEMLTVFTSSTTTISKQEETNEMASVIKMELPYFIMLLLFAGPMALGIDAIAGEKERGTLSSMLITPVSRTQIVAGKLIGIAVLSAINAMVYALSMGYSLSRLGSALGEDDGLGITFSTTQILQLLAVMVTLVLFYVAVVGLIGSLSKDVKTGNALVMPVYFIVILLGVATMTTGGKEVATSSFFIPVYGCALAIQEICNNSLSAIGLIGAVSSPLVATVLLTLGMGKVFNSEKIMFNA